MKLRFYSDPETGLAHLRRHDVTEDEAEEALLLSGEDRPGKDGVRIAIGQTRAGRYLRVIYVADAEPDDVFVITAYEQTGKHLLAYRKRRRRGRKKR